MSIETLHFAYAFLRNVVSVNVDLQFLILSNQLTQLSPGSVFFSNTLFDQQRFGNVPYPYRLCLDVILTRRRRISASYHLENARCFAFAQHDITALSRIAKQSPLQRGLEERSFSRRNFFSFERRRYKRRRKQDE